MEHKHGRLHLRKYNPTCKTYISIWYTKCKTIVILLTPSISMSEHLQPSILCNNVNECYLNTGDSRVHSSGNSTLQVCSKRLLLKQGHCSLQRLSGCVGTIPLASFRVLLESFKCRCFSRHSKSLISGSPYKSLLSDSFQQLSQRGFCHVYCTTVSSSSCSAVTFSKAF